MVCAKHEFQPDALYYALDLIEWSGELVPVVSTWAYTPLAGRSGREDGCTPPEGSHCFSLVRFDHEWEASSIVRAFPSLRTARSKMLPWEELVSGLDQVHAPGEHEPLKREEPEAHEDIQLQQRMAHLGTGALSGSLWEYTPGTLYYEYGRIGWKRRREPHVATSVYDGIVPSPCAAKSGECVCPSVLRFSDLIWSQERGFRPGRPIYVHSVHEAQLGFRRWTCFRALLVQQSLTTDQTGKRTPFAGG